LSARRLRRPATYSTSYNGASDAVTAIEAAARDLIRSVEPAGEDDDRLPTTHAGAIIGAALSFTDTHIGAAGSCWPEDGLAEAARELVDLVERITAGARDGGGAVLTLAKRAG